MANTIVSKKEHFILTRGAARPLVDGDISNEAPTFSRYCVLPTSRFLLGFYIRSITSGSAFRIRVYTYDGDNEAERVLVLDCGNCTKPTSELVIMKSDLCMSRLVVEVEQSGTVDCRIVIRPIDEAESGSVAATTDTDELRHRTELLISLNRICEHLGKILNHQRYITGLEQDKGDEY